ncbi:EAL domain-containing protein [Aestuariirhabdus sp. Z084]|uniref:putative bifunctional diguanylate cyclase/phosphodiesterase n=1 Tax=Aestuariirhabdus haliotis TaxID=2918751 RepID=UPI00201B3B18|nr:EAL domain-containing protein [Aestuariirhabdus haliotis]MCL6416013.1 EAL domain-containing protein [Aestuariirhabdus haliotis]MCL6419954.1 EAL domain-containing protein [Aestuariirhabdus haliotis]
MKLTQRVNYILMPVILSVFTLSGWITYEAYALQLRDDLVRQTQRGLTFAEREVQLELRTVRSALSQIFNSAELINFVNAKDPEYQSFTFEQRIYKVLEQSKQNSKGLETLQILSKTGQLLISAGDRDPFAEPAIAPIPGKLLQNYLNEVTSGEGIPRAREGFFQGADGHIKFFLLKPFSAHSMDINELSLNAEADFSALLIANVKTLGRIQQRTADFLGTSSLLRFTPDLDFNPRTNSHELGTSYTTSNNGDMTFYVVNPLFNLELLIPNSFIVQELILTRQIISILVVLLTLFSYATLKLLINRQIVAPIHRLIEKIDHSQNIDSIEMIPEGNQDELGELNNAYLNLLKDVQHLASYDHLTGLSNRRSFNKILDRQLRKSIINKQSMALLFIDLDNFKRVNDQYGHAAGDQLLLEFAKQLQTCIRPTDVAATASDDQLARLAGDEFSLLLPDVADPQAAERVAQRVLDLFEHGFKVNGIYHNVHASIGIAMVPDDGNNAEALLVHADAAMYQAKDQGKNQYQFFNQQIAQRMQERQHIEQILIQSLAERSFEMLFMPIYDANSLQPVSAEALLRCPALAEQGLGPDQFIPIAESTGLIKQIDLRVIDEALGKLRWLQEHLDFSGKMAINISAVELHNKAFPSQVQKLLDQHAVDPGKVELEITETSLINNDEESIDTLRALKALGVSLALDDFGTGYTAFNQLASYPVDCLKIDRSFVASLSDSNSNKQPMVDIILSLADLYHLHVVAEGVETEEQLQYLQRQACQLVQGYYLSKPIPWDELVALFTTTRVQEIH